MKKPLQIRDDFSLKDYNSFHLDIRADHFISLNDPIEAEGLAELSFWKDQPILVLGEGTNILFTGNFKGTVIHPAFRGISILEKDHEYAWVQVAAGEKWDDFVKWSVDRNLGGVENLSLIPGLAGAAPVQNIGAYGVEAGNLITVVKGFDLISRKAYEINGQDCEFGYRTSVFKTRLRNRFLITGMVFRLRLEPEFKLGYGPVEKLFREKEKQDLRSLRETIIEIRESKLPDPEKTGNAGSFFKNPVVGHDIFEKVVKDHPDIPYYQSGDCYKIPAAWLIEKAGWKGKREGAVGTWPSQPLVIVNYGGASGMDILRFSEAIRKDVKDKFGIGLEREINLVQGA